MAWSIPCSLRPVRRHRLTREDHRGNRPVEHLPRSEPAPLVPTGAHPTLTGVRILDAQASDESGGTLAITVIAPVRSRDGKFLGAIEAIVGVPPLTDILDDTMRGLKNIEWTEESHIEYQLLNEKGDLIAGSTLRQEGTLNLKQLGLPSATHVEMNERGLVEETHLRRVISVITAYAQVTIAHADPILHWGILIHVDRDSILAPIRSFL